MKGCKYWQDRNRLHSQENNGIEELVWGLEYCGPTAAINCVSSLLDIYEFQIGSWIPQPEDLVTLFFIDHVHWKEFQDVRKLNLNSVPPNRVPQYYPLVIETLYPTIECKFQWFADVGKNVWEYMKDNIETTAFQLCLIEPGHYIAVHAYDQDKDVFLFKDSWISQYPNKDGFNRPLTFAEFQQNIEPYMVTYRSKV